LYIGGDMYDTHCAVESCNHLRMLWTVACIARELILFVFCNAFVSYLTLCLLCSIRMVDVWRLLPSFVTVTSVLWHCWLGGRKGIWPVKNWVVGCLHGYICLEWDADLHYSPSWCHCHSLSLASVKSRLVLPFWHWITWIVPEKGPLNVCACMCLWRLMLYNAQKLHKVCQITNEASLQEILPSKIDYFYKKNVMLYHCVIFLLWWYYCTFCF